MDDVENPKATFDSFDSLKDIAVGAGIGLRYDFGFILRLDTGFKAYNPTYSINNRWFKDFNFSNAVYNFGINYPFLEVFVILKRFRINLGISHVKILTYSD